ncbi:hypothetical protein DQ384_30925 [Sphaerisporangium album]|uniref:Uncharacterized protein n=1 Tax=Sphaerisporangium album TaxID=509200 RepID=A0A367F7T5_9ACTN|nr:hypothetical protein DQ384_30925 [Sphaerisporangium album]
MVAVGTGSNGTGFGDGMVLEMGVGAFMLEFCRCRRPARLGLRDASPVRLPLFEEDTVLVIAHWAYTGNGLSVPRRPAAP